MKHWIDTRTIVVTLFFAFAASAALLAQGSPLVSRGWTSTGEGWRFDDTEYVWRYNEHTLNRQLLYTLDLMTSPDRAEEKAVAWAHPFEGIEESKKNEVMADVLRSELGVAIRKEEEGRTQYFVLSEGLLATLATDSGIVSATALEWADLDELLQTIEEGHSVYVVGIEKMPSILKSSSAARRISSWKEIPLAADELSWEFWAQD